MGWWRDDDSGLHYNLNRYYDAESGQYLSVDPIGLAGGLRTHAYVFNATGWVDPLGLVRCPAIILGRKVYRDNSLIDVNTPLKQMDLNQTALGASQESELRVMMSGNAFSKGGVKVSPSDLDHVEEKLAVELPDDLRELLLSVNGGIPSKAYWPLDNGEFLWVKGFLSAIDSQGQGRTIEETYDLGRRRSFLPKELIPFAIDHGGNYFCIDSDDRVYYYVVDKWDPGASVDENVRRAKRYLVDGLRAFVDRLEEDGY